MKPVLVLGFYNKANLGDEMFKETLPKLLPDFQCVFTSTDVINDSQVKPYGQLSSYQAIICGGGDIFNEYFMKDIQNMTQHYSGPVFALGMGIPYPSYFRSGHLQRFDQVFLRETTDLPELTLRIGARYAHFL